MKKLLHTLVLISFFGLLQACSATATDSQHQTTVNEELARSIIKGHYTYGPEVNALIPCESDLDFWVTGDEDTYELMVSRHQAVTSKPYEDVFVEVKGNFLGRATDGYAMEYDGQILVTELVQMRQRSDSDCM